MTIERILSPDFGHIFQNCDKTEAIEYILTPQDRDIAKLASLELERKRREANKRDEDRDLTKLGVVFTDDDPEAA